MAVVPLSDNSSSMKLDLQKWMAAFSGSVDGEGQLPTGPAGGCGGRREGDSQRPWGVHWDGGKVAIR